MHCSILHCTAACTTTTHFPCLPWGATLHCTPHAPFTPPQKHLHTLPPTAPHTHVYCPALCWSQCLPFCACPLLLIYHHFHMPLLFGTGQGQTDRQDGTGGWDRQWQWRVWLALCPAPAFTHSFYTPAVLPAVPSLSLLPTTSAYPLPRHPTLY